MKARGCHQHVYTLKADRVSMTGVLHNGTEVLKGHGVYLRFAKPRLNLCVVKLARKGVVENEGGLRPGKGPSLWEGGGGEKWEGGRSVKTEGSTPIIASSLTQSGFFRMA